MTALLRSMRGAGGRGLLVAVPVLLWSAYLVMAGSWRAWVRDLGGVTGLLFVALLLVLVAVVSGCRRSAVTLDHRDILRRVACSTEEYCLVLLPSGCDGRVAVPDTGADRRGSRARPDLTLEQVVALAARAALDHPTYALVDEDRVLAPPGPTCLRVPGPERQPVARRLIARAHSIVLVLAAAPDPRSGFGWEVEQIVRAGMAHRVIIVLPPPERDGIMNPAALQRAALLVATLRGSGRADDVDPFTVYEYELQLGAGTVVIKCTRGRRVHAWTTWPAGASAEPRRAREVVAATSYVAALAEAITDTEHELRGLDFAVRYPR